MAGPKKVSEKQLIANRRNAKRSTGPRTPQGKAKSRWNALKHGVLAKAVIPEPLLPFESRAQLDSLLAILRDELAPATALEEMLVERIATSYWRLARLLRAEAGIIGERLGSIERDLANQEQFAAHYDDSPVPSAGSLAASVAAISAALDGGSAEHLRPLFQPQAPGWEDSSGDELVAHARQVLAGLHEDLARHRARDSALERAKRGIPDIHTALLLARYEASLDRQIYRALNALERIQRLRGGDAVPPPLNLSVDLNAPPGGSPGE